MRSMFTLSVLRELLDHMEWADATVWSAVAHSAAARGDDVVRERLRHSHLTQRFFLSLWEASPLDFSEVQVAPPIEAILASARTYFEALHQYVQTVSDEQLTTEVEIPWARRFARADGTMPATHLGETIYQVVAHSTYHRGQVNTRLRELGVEPPLVDYIAWIWSARPRPSWPQR